MNGFSYRRPETLEEALSLLQEHGEDAKVIAGGTALICIGYIGAIYVVGMTLASALCVAATIYYFGERRAWVICAIAIILPALLWYFFVKIAHILFPTPWLGVMERLESVRLFDGTTDVARLIMPLAG